MPLYVVIRAAWYSWRRYACRGMLKLPLRPRANLACSSMRQYGQRINVSATAPKLVLGKATFAIRGRWHHIRMAHELRWTVGARESMIWSAYIADNMMARSCKSKGSLGSLSAKSPSESFADLSSRIPLHLCSHHPHGWRSEDVKPKQTLPVGDKASRGDARP